MGSILDPGRPTSHRGGEKISNRGRKGEKHSKKESVLKVLKDTVMYLS